MASAVKVRIDTREFTSTLKRYAALSKRTPAEICNRKGFAITRRTIWYTHKADPQKIVQELGAAEAFTLRINKGGKNKGKYSQAKANKTYAFNNTASGAAGRFERIFLGRLRKEGRKIPAAAELASMMLRAFKARLRSVAFIKSGFIPARDGFKNWCRAHNVPLGKSVAQNEGTGVGGPKEIGQKKGGVSPASFNWFTRATFFNAANATHGTNKNALSQFAGAAMQAAFTEETRDTVEEIEKRLKTHAQTCGIKTH
jgi:hypothetical protein